MSGVLVTLCPARSGPLVVAACASLYGLKAGIEVAVGVSGLLEWCLHATRDAGSEVCHRFQLIVPGTLGYSKDDLEVLE